MFTALLIRHAEPVLPAPGLSEYERPLTARGRADAESFAETFAALAIDAIYASPYARAHQTVVPLARPRGLTVGAIADLRERLLSPDLLSDWRDHVARSWQDDDYAPPGGETGRAARARILAVLDDVRARHPGGTVALGSHGNLIALALGGITAGVDFAFWDAMPMPAIYRLEHAGAAWRAVSGPGLR
jgi:2,3-bisphosphoglycerate-dependent phosphoglycerate mutase